MKASRHHQIAMKRPLPSVRSRLAADYRVATADLEVCHIEG